MTANEPEITLRLVPYPKIALAACYSHMGKRQRKGEYGVDETRAPLEIKDRWSVNYIRHGLTNYDELIRKHPDKQTQIKLQVLDLIAETYPKLRFECERQKRYALEKTEKTE